MHSFSNTLAPPQTRELTFKSPCHSFPWTPVASSTSRQQQSFSLFSTRHRIASLRFPRIEFPTYNRPTRKLRENLYILSNKSPSSCCPTTPSTTTLLLPNFTWDIPVRHRQGYLVFIVCHICWNDKKQLFRRRSASTPDIVLETQKSITPGMYLYRLCPTPNLQPLPLSPRHDHRGGLPCDQSSPFLFASGLYGRRDVSRTRAPTKPDRHQQRSTSGSRLMTQRPRTMEDILDGRDLGHDVHCPL